MGWNANVNGNHVGAKITLRPPFFSDLNTRHKTISGIGNFAESINNLSAKFLPRVADFNGTDDEVSTLIDLSGATSAEYEFDVYRSSNGIYTVIGQYDTASVSFAFTWHINNNIYVYAAGAYAYITNLDTGWFRFKVVFDGSQTGDAGRLKLYKNDVLQTLTNWIGTVGTSLDSITKKFIIGARAGGIYATMKCSYCSISKNGVLVENYYPTGQGDYEYDVSGNNNHGTWSGTGARFDFDHNGSTYPNDNGYSQWRHSTYPTLPDIQVPFDINGNPLSLTAGVDIPAGYTHTRDLVAGGSKWNMADALVDFDPDGNVGDIIINGDFATDTDWAKAAEWTISGGTANCDGTQSGDSLLRQNNILGGVIGEKYFVSWEVKNYTAGNVAIQLGGNPSASSGDKSVNGVYTHELITADTIDDLFIIGDTDFIGSVDNIFVYKITQIGIFNRFNSIRQTATSRASLFYDANYTFRYQINEIADPRIYDTFFETDYKNRVFGKVRLSGTDIIRYDEELNYQDKKTGSDLTKITSYCKISDIYP